MSILRKALAHLKKHKVDDEIGPESPGSKHIGIWFHDPDGLFPKLLIQANSRVRKTLFANGFRMMDRHLILPSPANIISTSRSPVRGRARREINLSILHLLIKSKYGWPRLGG
jgi:hypothetical protein